MINILSKITDTYHKITKTKVNYWRWRGVKIGHGCSFISPHFGGEPFLVTIGDHVQLTDNVQFLTHGGGWVFRKEIPDLDFFGKIVVKNNVYIGSRAYILPGVTIESNVIVAAMSVVTKSVPSGVIVAGNPAKIVGKLDDFKSKIGPYNLRTKGLDEKKKMELILNASQDKFITKDYMK